MGANGKTILAVDPGSTTGFAHYNGKIIEPYTATSLSEVISICNSLLDRTDLVLIERFISTPKMGIHSAYPAIIIGAVEACCIMRNVPYEIKIPAHRLVATPGDVYQKTNLKKVFNRHELDAAKHIVAYQMMEK